MRQEHVAFAKSTLHAPRAPRMRQEHVACAVTLADHVACASARCAPHPPPPALAQAARSREVESALRRRSREVEALRSEVDQLRRGHARVLQESARLAGHPTSIRMGHRPAMTLLERFSAVRSEIGLPPGLDMLTTLRQAKEMLAIEVRHLYNICAAAACPETRCIVLGHICTCTHARARACTHAL